jgi:hypothetical protein
MLTGQIAAQEINKALASDREPNIRHMARRIVFQSITQQHPELPRKVRRELARVYESERWMNRQTQS